MTLLFSSPSHQSDSSARLITHRYHRNISRDPRNFFPHTHSHKRKLFPLKPNFFTKKNLIYLFTIVTKLTFPVAHKTIINLHLASHHSSLTHVPRVTHLHVCVMNGSSPLRHPNPHTWDDTFRDLPHSLFHPSHRPPVNNFPPA